MKKVLMASVMPVYVFKTRETKHNTIESCCFDLSRKGGKRRTKKEWE